MIRKDKVVCKDPMSESVFTDSGTVAIISEPPTTVECWELSTISVFEDSDTIVTDNEYDRS